MSCQYSRVDLKSLIEANDTDKVRQILLTNPELLNQPECIDAKCLLLAKATCYNKKEMTEILLKWPGLMKPEDNIDLKKYLIRAIFRGNVPLTEFLLNNGAKLESVSAIRYVFYRTNIETRKDMLSLLLKYGLNTKILNDRGQNILHQFIHFFVEKKDQDAAGIAEILLKCGISVDEPDWNGYTPLHHAVLKQNVKLISFFLQKKANVNSKSDTSGIFPLHLAVQCHNNCIVDMLLLFGAEINAQTSSGWTALHKACLHYNEKMINFFIRKGADISLESNDGETPFSVLDPEAEEYERCVKVLVKEFAKKQYENIPVSPTDMHLINSKPKAKKHFENCLDELELMADTEFYAPHTFYTMLNKSIDVKKLSLFTKNEELVSKFEENLERFSYYDKDLHVIWDEAIEMRNIAWTIEYRLYSIFGEFFPDIVMKKLAENLTLEDLPLS